MNKREAKRRACFLAANWIEDAVGMGYESIYVDPDDETGMTDLSGADMDRVEQALHEVAAELLRRS